MAFASCSGYRSRECYAGVAEYSVYVARDHRGTGAGRVAIAALIDAATEAELWKLVSRYSGKRRAAPWRAWDFARLGCIMRHGKLGDEWRDCVIVERLLGEAPRVSAAAAKQRRSCDR